MWKQEAKSQVHNSRMPCQCQQLVGNAVASFYPPFGHRHKGEAASEATCPEFRKLLVTVAGQVTNQDVCR